MYDPFEYLTVIQFTACCSIIFVAAILQMVTGMGFGMIAAPLLALVKPELVPGTVLAMGLVVAASGTWRERKNISLGELKLGVGGRLIGSAIAAMILLLIPSVEVFMILFGALMLAAVSLTASGLQITFNKTNLLNLSIVSGVMGTITAVGAPPMAIIYHNRPAKIVRPTLNAFFGSGAVIGLVSLYFSGWLPPVTLLVAVMLLPAMLIGIRLSVWFENISAQWLSHILLGLSAISSLLLLLRGLG